CPERVAVRNWEPVNPRTARWRGGKEADMTIATNGLHHVTAIAGDPQRNVDFYLRTLGLSLVKSTVNFDDPGTYHLYYGDAAGRPGKMMTFFPWKGAPSGRQGTGQATTTALSVPAGSIGWWKQ